MLKEYRFILPDGTKPTTQTNLQQEVDLIEAALIAHPMELNEDGQYIVTDVELFYAMADLIQEELTNNNSEAMVI